MTTGAPVPSQSADALITAALGFLGSMWPPVKSHTISVYRDVNLKSPLEFEATQADYQLFSCVAASTLGWQRATPMFLGGRRRDENANYGDM